MPLIEIAPKEFINTDQVQTVAYKPATTRAEEKTDASDYNLPKTVQTDILSSVHVTLCSGEKIVKSGEEADALFTKLTGKQVDKKKPAINIGLLSSEELPPRVKE